MAGSRYHKVTFGRAWRENGRRHWIAYVDGKDVGSVVEHEDGWCSLVDPPGRTYHVAENREQAVDNYLADARAVSRG